MGAERRQFLRVACRGAIAELFVHGASVGMHSVQDVSEGGLFVESPSPVLPLDTEVEVHIVDSRPEARSAARVVQVVRPGSGRPTGYALQLTQVSNDIVDAVASAARPTSVAPISRPQPAAPSQAPTETPRVLIAIHSLSLRRALCMSLIAFDVPAVQVAPDGFEDALGKSLRAALMEMTSIEAAIVQMRALHAAAPKARALLLARKLPDGNGRRQLQAAGADQLVLPPLDPFDVLKTLYTKARGGKRG